MARRVPTDPRGGHRCPPIAEVSELIGWSRGVLSLREQLSPAHANAADCHAPRREWHALRPTLSISVAIFFACDNHTENRTELSLKAIESARDD